MKLDVVIVGYGNLGKSLEREIGKNDKINLKAIYSRRSIENPLFRPFGTLKNCIDADVALIALGSYNDVTENIESFAGLDTVDSYDVHANIAAYKEKLRKAKANKLSIVGAGWDPGLLSLARGVFGIGAKQVTTVWGKGISQGHSNALRSITGVLDAVQFTVPKSNCDELLRQGETDAKKLVNRECFVACVQKDTADIYSAIVHMPHYFEGYDTTVTFCSPKEVRKLKEQTAHKGVASCVGEGFSARCEVQMESNADYTAKIMLGYALAVPQLKKDGFKGPLDVYDIPLKYLANTDRI